MNSQAVITTHYVVVGFNTGDVEVDTVGGGKSVLTSTLQLNHNTPVVALAFPNIENFAKADARGLTLVRFNPATGTMTDRTGVGAPEGTPLVAMASSRGPLGQPNVFYVAVFSDGTIIEFNPMNGNRVRTIENSTPTN